MIIIGQSTFYTSYWPNVDIYVGTVPKAMLTVFQAITLESWSEAIARPISKKDPAIVFGRCLGDWFVMVR